MKQCKNVSDGTLTWYVCRLVFFFLFFSVHEFVVGPVKKRKKGPVLDTRGSEMLNVSFLFSMSSVDTLRGGACVCVATC